MRQTHNRSLLLIPFHDSRARFAGGLLLDAASPIAKNRLVQSPPSDCCHFSSDSSSRENSNCDQRNRSAAWESARLRRIGVRLPITAISAPSRGTIGSAVTTPKRLGAKFVP